MPSAAQSVLRAETVLRRILWGAHDVGAIRTIGGMARLGLLSLRGPSRAELVTRRTGLRIAFDYPAQLMPLMVVFQELLDPELGLLPKLLAPGRVALDVGASIGTWTLPAALTGATVFACEPQADNLKTLRENLRLNNLESNVIVHHAALGRGDGWSSMAQADRRYLTNVRLATEFEESSHTPVHSLDHYLDRLRVERVDILKINTAGCEADVIAGALQSFRSGRIGLALVLDGLVVRPMLDELKPYSYELGFYDGRKRKWIAAHSSSQLDELRPGPLNRYVLVKHSGLAI